MTQGLLELGEIMMSASQRRLEIVARNVSNVSTPGYRAGRVYEEVLASQANGEATYDSPNARIVAAADFSDGALQFTGAPLDLAVTGAGFFALRDGEETLLVRSAHFQRDLDGRVVDSDGRPLLGVAGNDIVLSAGPVEILSDGTMMRGGLPQARIAVLAPEDAQSLSSAGGALFRAGSTPIRTVEEPLVRQGMIENSNVDTAEEMLQMMTAVRQAETGARIVQAYDTLIGQAITTLGRAQR